MNKKKVLWISLLIIVLVILSGILLKNVFKENKLVYGGNNQEAELDFLATNYNMNTTINVSNTMDNDVEVDLVGENITYEGDGKLFYQLFDENYDLVDEGFIHHGEENILASVKLPANSTEVYSLSAIFIDLEINKKIKIKGDFSLRNHVEEDYALLDGENLNEKILRLANPDVENVKYADNYYTEFVDKNIKKIKIAPEMNKKYENSNYIVSMKDSSVPIYMWFEDNTLYFYASKKIRLSKKVSNMFERLSELNDVSDLRYFDFSQVEYMDGFLMKDSSLSDISFFEYIETNNLKYADDLFRKCESLYNIIPLANLKTGKLVSMSRMLDETGITDIRVLMYWDVSQVEYMDALLRNTEISDIEALSYWNISNVKSFTELFSYTRVDSLEPLSRWDVSNIKYFLELFKGTKIENLDALKKWNVANGVSFFGMFSSCFKLKDISGIKDWNVANAESLAYMFSDTAIENVDALKKWDTSNVESIDGMFYHATKLKNIDGLAEWQVKRVESMNSTFYQTKIESCEALEKWVTFNVESMKGTFQYTNINSLSCFKDWDTSDVIDFRYLFANTKIESLNGIENWNTLRGEKFDYMFSLCKNLKDKTAVSNWKFIKGLESSKLMFVDTKVDS